jgi:uncharacterized membrane protein
VNKFHIISDDDPLIRPTTGSELTTGNMARLASSTAATLAKLQAMNKALGGLNNKLDDLRVDLDAMKAERTRNDAAKAASEAFRATQQ